MSSYPTYEEWKPSQVQRTGPEVVVLILPMRNGNKEELKTVVPALLLFLSYL